MTKPKGYKPSRRMTRNISSVKSSTQLTGKPYTGDWMSWCGSEKEYAEKPLTPFPSDTECLCLVELEDGTKEPDYWCVECKGTGKRRFYSLYEQTIMSAK